MLEKKKKKSVAITSINPRNTNTDFLFADSYKLSIKHTIRFVAMVIISRGPDMGCWRLQRQEIRIVGTSCTYILFGIVVNDFVQLQKN